MVLPHERDIGGFGNWHSAATLASAIVVLGLVVGWPTQQAVAPAMPAPASCTGGDDVSNFVCRNRWVAGLAHHHR